MSNTSLLIRVSTPALQFNGTPDEAFRVIEDLTYAKRSLGDFSSSLENFLINLNLAYQDHKLNVASKVTFEDMYPDEILERDELLDDLLEDEL